MSAGGDERPGHATRRPVLVGILAPCGVRAGTDAGRTRAAEGHGRRLILCTRHRTDPVSGCANNGDAPGRKRAALRTPTSTGSADNAVLDDLTLDLHLDHLASLREHCSSNLGAAASAGAGPCQRDDHALVGVIDQGASDTASARLSTWLAPAWLELRAWWRPLER